MNVSIHLALVENTCYSLHRSMDSCPVVLSSVLLPFLEDGDEALGGGVILMEDAEFRALLSLCIEALFAGFQLPLHFYHDVKSKGNCGDSTLRTLVSTYVIKYLTKGILKEDGDILAYSLKRDIVSHGQSGMTAEASLVTLLLELANPE